MVKKAGRPETPKNTGKVVVYIDDELHRLVQAAALNTKHRGSVSAWVRELIERKLK